MLYVVTQYSTTTHNSESIGNLAKHDIRHVPSKSSIFAILIWKVQVPKQEIRSFWGPTPDELYDLEDGISSYVVGLWVLPVLVSERLRGTASANRPKGVVLVKGRGRGLEISTLRVFRAR